VSFEGNGSEERVRVNASRDDCAWAVTNQPSWITIARGATGTGDDDVELLAAPNPSTVVRSGTITIAGQGVSLIQEAFEGENVQFEGSVSGLSGTCPALTFTVRGRTVRTNGSTDFRGGSCSALRNGDNVDVRGTTQPDGSVLASRVDRENDDDDDEGDDDGVGP
jgi:Domain of unknown function (DUF5666)/Putative binding domain, N-terminal